MTHEDPFLNGRSWVGLTESAFPANAPIRAGGRLQSCVNACIDISYQWIIIQSLPKKRLQVSTAPHRFLAKIQSHFA